MKNKKLLNKFQEKSRTQMEGFIIRMKISSLMSAVACNKIAY